MGVIVTAPPSATGAICRDAVGTAYAVRIGDRLARIATNEPLPSFHLDENGMGQIDAAALRSAFEKLGGNLLTEEEALDVVAAYDPDCNGYMDIDEFEDLAREAMLSNVTEIVSGMERPFELHFSRQLTPSSGIGPSGVVGADEASDFSARIRRASKKNLLETLGEEGEDILRHAAALGAAVDNVDALEEDSAEVMDTDVLSCGVSEGESDAAAPSAGEFLFCTVTFHANPADI